MSAVQSNPDAKLNSFFAKKKKKAKPVGTAVATPTATSTSPASPPQRPAASPATAAAAPKIVSPKGPVIQTKGKTIAELKTVATPAADDDEDEEGEASGASVFQWSKKPKKKNTAQPTDGKKFALTSDRAFPTLANAAGGAAAVNVAAAGKPVKPPSDVRSQNVWASIDDSDDEDK
ncbi:Aste57867_14414 [Aphanomyces stellatus]|uniref:Aste57867_14414 protein n=1 Tax=Aphanomyces stellatus TaxID=120398 RepID=A0A485L0Y4_9STRA|nr:hypothetical protein As57867_014360 [Aphanomyces stellatus]VFT91236.1 Aste57867_14414 [Aphanomyces stellatus]